MCLLQDEEVADRAHPISEATAPPRKETAWERGLKLAKEVCLTPKLNEIIVLIRLEMLMRFTKCLLTVFTIP